MQTTVGDRLRCDELRAGHWIRVKALNDGPEWQKVQSVTQVDDGVVVPIYRITFYDNGFRLMANGDRVFEVASMDPNFVVVRTAD